MALDPVAGLRVFKGNFWIWYNALTRARAVLTHFAITLDVDITKPILIASPQLDKESEVYMDQLKLEVIEGSDFGTIIKDLEAFIKGY